MQRNAFTIIEMSIVLVIVGLLIAMITMGNQMMQQSNARAVINEVRGIQQSLNTFKLQYNYLPGDLPNATSFWATSANGNGNGVIDYNTGVSTPLEDTYVFQQLYLANIINLSFSGGAQGGGTNRYVAGVNAYPSRLSGAGYFVASNVTLYHIIYAPQQLQFGSATNGNSGVLNGQAVTSNDAYYIDQKMDDGVPSSGNVMTGRAIALDATANTCVSQTISTAPPITYVLTDATVSCRMFFTLKGASGT
jgi:prepilin-type N-terminal cleavage/methylation domain-containing protein